MLLASSRAATRRSSSTCRTRARIVPDAHRAARLTPAARALPDTDWHVEKLYAFARDAGATLHGRDAFALRRRPQSRSVRRRAVPGRRQHRALPDAHVRQRAASTLHGEAPSAATRSRRAAARSSRRITRCSRAEIERVRARHGYAVLLDGHSIRARGAALLRGTPARPQPRHGGRRELRRRRCSALAAARARRRAPASRTSSTAASRAATITRHYGRPARRRARAAARDGAGGATWTRRRRTRGTPRAPRALADVLERLVGGARVRLAAARDDPLLHRAAALRRVPASPIACSQAGHPRARVQRARVEHRRRRAARRRAAAGVDRARDATASARRSCCARSTRHAAQGRRRVLRALRRGVAGQLRPLLELRQVACSHTARTSPRGRCRRLRRPSRAPSSACESSRPRRSDDWCPRDC